MISAKTPRGDAWTREGVRRAVHVAVASALDRPPSTIRDGARFLADLDVDSIAVLDLLCALEETFDVAIDEVEAFPVETVGELVELIATELSPPPGDGQACVDHPPCISDAGADARPPVASARSPMASAPSVASRGAAPR
ncbi:MAG: phosphopantetheine-binding protein [Acidobacteriota bacterium]